MDDACFHRWQALMTEIVGLNITREKAYLFETRLRPLMLRLDVDLDAVYHLTQADPRGEVGVQVIELMTTHETSFFRDQKPFDLLAYLIETLVNRRGARGDRTLHLLSAGCSTGEEPYSMAMVLEETLTRSPGFSYRIHACDIAEPTLEKARAGWYRRIEPGVSAQRAERFFQPENGGWRVADRLRQKVVFQRRNLLDLEHLGMHFDIVFCRNVVIYFHPDVRGLVYEQLAGHLNPDGCLVVGASEGLSGFRLLQRFEGPGGFYYQPRVPVSL